VRRALAVALLALLLAACRVDTSVDLTMKADGTGTITVTVVADKDVVSQAPGLADDLRYDDLAKAGWTVDGLTTTAEGGLQLVLRHDIASAEQATALLRSLNGTNGPLHDATVERTVTAEEITTRLAGTLRVDGGLDAFADPDLLKSIGGAPYAADIAAAELKPTDVVTVAFTAHLPGEVVTTATGTAPVASWSVPIDGTAADLATTAVVAQGAGSNGWSALATAALVGLVLWVALAAAFILFVARARRARALRRLGAPVE
jgi:hypothetical protein